MINSPETESDSGHLLDYTGAKCNKTREKRILKLGVLLVYLGFAKGIAEEKLYARF